ncbi:hypothetical protein GEMRC1_002205 [Eukaryota sp. GEM-RC1]
MATCPESPSAISREISHYLSQPARKSVLSSKSVAPEPKHNPNVPFIPSWAIPSPFTTAPPSSPEMPPLHKLPPQTQEHILSCALVGTLLGHKSPFIEASPASVTLSDSLSSVNPQLLSLLEYCLPLIKSMLSLKLWANEHLHYSCGTIVHSTVSSLLSKISDFELLLAQIDRELASGPLNLSKIVASISKHKIVLSKLDSVFRSLNSQGCVFLNDMVQKSLDFRGDESFPVFSDLVLSAMIPFVKF